MQTTPQCTTPELQQHLASLDELRSDVRALTDPLNHAQFNWRAAPDEWSIGQCLDHLNVAGFLLLPRLEEAVTQGRARGLTGTPPFRYGIFGRLFSLLMRPNPWLRFSSPAAYVPAVQHEPEVVVPRFIDLQDRLGAVVRAADGLDLKHIRLSSPVNRLMHFSLGIWLEGTLAHEQRHIVQAQSVRAHEAFPA